MMSLNIVNNHDFFGRRAFKKNYDLKNEIGFIEYLAELNISRASVIRSHSAQQIYL